MKTVSNTKIFVDTNILFYLTNPNDPFGHEAKGRVHELYENNNELFISNPVIREYAFSILRNATYHKMPFPQSVFTLIANINTFRKSFIVISEHKDNLDNWLVILPQLTSYKDVYDFNIAATMKSEGIKYILTHNVSDFKKFDSWLTVLPLLKNIEK